jgi:TDG/mug DNA glycosylase family protein
VKEEAAAACKEEGGPGAAGGPAPSTSGQAAIAAAAEKAAQLIPDYCKKARGRQGICLDNAVGVPERLGDQPLRLIVGGNNPSDHAW